MSNRIALPVTMILLISLLLGGALALSGCSDDPTDPDSGPNLPARSPEQWVTLYVMALAQRDADGYEALLAEEFVCHIDTAQVSYQGLLSNYLTRDEMVGAVQNIFSGQPVDNGQGEFRTAITGLRFDQVIQLTDWIEADDTTPYPGARVADFQIDLLLERASPSTPLPVAGRQRFYVAERTLPGGQDTSYLLLDIVEVTPEPAPAAQFDGEVSGSWGLVCWYYLTNLAPTSGLELEDLAAFPSPQLRCLAADASDPDSGLHELPFRWRVEAGGGWIDWSDAHELIGTYTTSGAKDVTLEVRDRWGVTSAVTESAEATLGSLPFPATKDQLMANFRQVYESMSSAGYTNMMRPDFRLFLQETTIESFDLHTDHFGFEQEVRIHQRLFSGVAVIGPDEYLVPAVTAIEFEQWFQETPWLEAEPDDPLYPGAEWAAFNFAARTVRPAESTTLVSTGVINVYVTHRDSLHEGSLQSYYQLQGIVDLTNLTKAIEDAPWGAVHALYR